MTAIEGSYDYIIIGAGSAGCVLAERLSRDPGRRVLLVEAGGPDDSPWIRMPKGVARLVTSPKHIWAYQVSQPRLPGEEAREIWLRGRGLGGSSSINGMIWSQGEPADYDAWEAADAAGWNGASMTDALRAIQDHALGAGGTRGTGGPVRVVPGTFRYPLTRAMIAAGESLGLTPTEDLNSLTGGRVGYYSHNIRRGRRDSAASAFLKPARRRPNLTILTRTTAERVTFSGKRADGVALIGADGHRTRADCAGEVILSAGALESPQILERSGVGGGALLRSLGIDMVADSPDVGNRMREHLGYSMPHRLKRQDGINRSYFGLGLVAATLRYYATRTGAMATGPFEVGAFANVAHPDGRVDFQMFLGGYTFALSDDRHPVPLNQVDKRPGITIYGQLLRLSSEGSIHIGGARPDAPAEITPNWLATEEDRRAAVAALRYMRRYMAQPALAASIAAELLPGDEVQTDDQIVDSFRRLAMCGLHATGTCRMGSDAAAVVDPRLRVCGVEGLRVVDCSVMPAPVTGNTNAPAMALAWRAADLVLEDAR